MEKYSKYCTIYVVRHGETIDNVAKNIAGHTNSVLTEKGESQGQLLGAKLKEIKFDVIFSSDLIRAKRTAEFVAMSKKLEVNTKEILRERNFGVWEGKSETDFYKENEQALKKQEQLAETEKQSAKLYDSYESDEELVSRFITFLREVATSYIGKTVLVVTHGGPIRTLLVHMGFASFHELPSNSIINTGYIKLESDGIDFFVKETVGVNKVKI